MIFKYCKSSLCKDGNRQPVTRAQDGTRAIHLAAWKGHAEFVKLLLGRGADVRVSAFILEARKNLPQQRMCAGSDATVGCINPL